MSRSFTVFSLVIIVGLIAFGLLAGSGEQNAPTSTSTAPTSTTATSSTDTNKNATGTTPAGRPISYTPEGASDLITIQKPGREATITSPVQISGQARGQWFSEGQAPVVLVDWDGRIIAEGKIQAEGNWMTDNYVPFSGKLTFTPPADTGPQSVRGSLILQRANPSGRPEQSMAVEIPVRFGR